MIFHYVAPIRCYPKTPMELGALRGAEMGLRVQKRAAVKIKK